MTSDKKPSRSELWEQATGVSIGKIVTAGLLLTFYLAAFYGAAATFRYWLVTQSWLFILTGLTIIAGAVVNTRFLLQTIRE